MRGIISSKSLISVALRLRYSLLTWILLLTIVIIRVWHLRLFRSHISRICGMWRWHGRNIVAVCYDNRSSLTIKRWVMPRRRAAMIWSWPVCWHRTRWLFCWWWREILRWWWMYYLSLMSFRTVLISMLCWCSLVFIVERITLVWHCWMFDCGPCCRTCQCVAAQINWIV